ncbi:hypothetical protein OPV22_021745 [Ensete ventricosum]|uniref:Uncharacterized protein n=1 Tax=Ensete ventricosum TaxID=4639 RepID=A0AAV8QSX0_ENSVE|nr:hypothetical protein OPV22_021745 [Ensete ventricosum]
MASRQRELLLYANPFELRVPKGSPRNCLLWRRTHVEDSNTVSEKERDFRNLLALTRLLDRLEPVMSWIRKSC